MSRFLFGPEVYEADFDPENRVIVPNIGLFDGIPSRNRWVNLIRPSKTTNPSSLALVCLIEDLVDGIISCNA
jgi:hypothetical protein